MADNFLQATRMNSIFAPNTDPGPNPDAISAIINRIAPFIQSQKDDERNFQEHMFNLAHPQPNQDPLVSVGHGQLGRIGQSMANPQQQQPMNTVFQPSMSDYQKANLALSGEKVKQGEEKIKQSGEIARGKLDVSEQDSATRKQRADIYDFKSRHPNMTFKIDKGGNFIAFDPGTGKGMDTGIGSGTLSDAERAEIIGEQQINAIDERNKGNENIQNIRGQQALDQIGNRIAGQKEVKGMTPAKTELPTQTRVREMNNAHKLMNTNPELGQHVSFNPDGSVKVTPSGDALIDQKVNDAIYGSGNNNPGTDIELPPDSPKSKSPSKSSSKSSDNDPLGIRK